MSPIKPGVGKVRPAGEIWPMSSINPARSGSIILTLNLARVLPPNAPKDEWLFSCWEGFSCTLTVNADWLSYTHLRCLATLHLTHSVNSPVTLRHFWWSLKKLVQIWPDFICIESFSRLIWTFTTKSLPTPVLNHINSFKYDLYYFLMTF